MFVHVFWLGSAVLYSPEQAQGRPSPRRKKPVGKHLLQRSMEETRVAQSMAKCTLTKGVDIEGGIRAWVHVHRHVFHVSTCVPVCVSAIVGLL